MTRDWEGADCPNGVMAEWQPYFWSGFSVLPGGSGSDGHITASLLLVMSLSHLSMRRG